MYTYDDLSKYEYFKDVDISHVLDSLTGVISRPYILGFAKDLIKRKVPFSMCIMDIDNFKLINDNYGHMSGDLCLKALGNSFVKYVGDTGLVGRFGGDEFVLLCFKAYDYDSLHAYITALYEKGNIVRKMYKLDNIYTFVTGTIGSASYPKDAKTYDELFTKVDKALYRGKSKGRNCFIVYVEEKHKDIDVHRREITALPVLFDNILSIANNGGSVNKKIKEIVDYINETLMLGVSFVCIIDDNKIISSNRKTPFHYDKEYVDSIGVIMGKKNIVYSNELQKIKDEYKLAEEYLDSKSIQSIISVKIIVDGEVYGYFVMAENKIVRIWQEHDIALAMYVERILALLIKK